VTSVLLTATIVLLVFASLRPARRSVFCTFAGIALCALFLFSSQLVRSIVSLAEAFPPHIPLTLAAIELYPSSRSDTRRLPRLAAAMFLAGMTCDRLPFIWTGIALIVWTALACPRRLRRTHLPIAAVLLVGGALSAHYLWKSPPLLGLAVGTNARRSGWVNLDVVQYLTLPGETLSFAVALLFKRSTVALFALWLAVGVYLTGAKELLEFDPHGAEKSRLAWLLACGFVTIAVVAPDTSLVGAAAFVILAIRAALLPSQWMLARLHGGTGLEGALVAAVALFQLGSGFWLVHAVHRFSWEIGRLLR